MVEVMMVLTVLNTAVAVAALVLAVGKRIAAPSCGTAGNDEGAEKDERPFKLSDKKMQEGIANLLGYQPGDRGNEE